MCKFGDYFLYLDIDEDQGVRTAIGLPSMEIERLEGEDKTNPNYVQYQWNSAGMTFENWQVAHFRILGNDKYAPYGTSVLSLLVASGDSYIVRRCNDGLSYCPRTRETCILY
jgi:hypothetical protein